LRNQSLEYCKRGELAKTPPGSRRLAEISRVCLHEISRIMGLPGKSKGFDGGDVERYFREGKIKEIADYCQSDVVGTYQVWLRYELFRGTLSRDAFEASQQNLADFMAARSNHQQGAR
jgi:3'-5' exonuclease